MLAIEVLEKYLQVSMTSEFILHGKKLACKLTQGLRKGFCENLWEPCIVSTIEKIINEVGGWCTSTNKFKIDTRSIFIHGNKSIVKLECSGEKCELGDIIFILSIVYKGKKYFEKLTISQMKNMKGKKGKT